VSPICKKEAGTRSRPRKPAEEETLEVRRQDLRAERVSSSSLPPLKADQAPFSRFRFRAPSAKRLMVVPNLNLKWVPEAGKSRDAARLTHHVPLCRRRCGPARLPGAVTFRMSGPDKGPKGGQDSGVFIAGQAKGAMGPADGMFRRPRHARGR
jgi:hypothetical protein